MSGATTLRTRDLGISFGAFQAVSDVNLVLEPGARQALIGPNGAGKTTLINLLTGVFRPTVGSIHMGEHELTTLSADKRSVDVSGTPVLVIGAFGHGQAPSWTQLTSLAATIELPATVAAQAVTR